MKSTLESRFCQGKLEVRTKASNYCPPTAKMLFFCCITQLIDLIKLIPKHPKLKSQNARNCLS